MRGLCSLLLLFLFPVAAEGASAYPCSATGSGPRDCTCVDWGAVFDIRCPAVSDWRELASIPGQRPTRDPGAAGPNAPGADGRVPGSDIESKLETYWKFLDAVRRARARGKLSPMLPKTHPDYEPTECMELFAPYHSSNTEESYPYDMTNGRWILNQFAIFRNGEGVRNASGAVRCDEPQTYAWTYPKQGYPYIFICDPFADVSDGFAAAAIIHELLHLAGLQEGGPGEPSSIQIQLNVRLACGL